MSSRKGRKVQMWISTPLGRLDKTIAHILYRTNYEQGLRGKLLEDVVFAKFEHLRPDHGRTKSSVTSRGMTTTISYHAERENVFINKYTSPYCGLAGQIIDSNRPWTKKELAGYLEEPQHRSSRTS